MLILISILSIFLLGAFQAVYAENDVTNFQYQNNIQPQEYTTSHHTNGFGPGPYIGCK